MRRTRAQRTRTPVERRRRHSARGALYASLVLVGALLAAILVWMRPVLPAGWAADWWRVDWESKREVQLLQEYIQIDTSEPNGDPAAGAGWFADRLAELGLEPVTERVGDQVNVWAVIEGRSPEAVVLHHHVDVDPVWRRSAWKRDPFSGDVEAWWIYGRGAFDMKSVAVAQLLAAARLVESGRTPERSVILLATAGEERGSDLGTRWLLSQHPELVERFAVVLTEGGAVEGRAMDDLKYWGTEFVQKRLVRVYLCNGSREPLARLEEELQVPGGVHGEPELVPEVERFLGSYAPTRDSQRFQRLLAEPEELLRNRVAFESLPYYLRSFFVNEASPQGLREMPDGTWVLRIHLSLLPGADPERVLDDLLPRWFRFGNATRVQVEPSAAHGSALDHWAYQALDRLMAERYPDTPHGPLVLPTTLTDARFFRRAGIPTYGFTPFPVLTPEVVQLRYWGTVNERMALPGYVEGVDLYAELLDRLVG